MEAEGDRREAAYLERAVASSITLSCRRPDPEDRFAVISDPVVAKCDHPLKQMIRRLGRYFARDRR
jgi:hypothetical protein